MSERSSPASTPEIISPEYMNGDRLKIVIAGLDQNIRPQAIEVANARLNEELGEGGWTKKFLRNIWKGNMAREYYLTKYTQEAEQAIKEHDNLLYHEGVDPEKYRVATTLRFAHEYDDLIHTEGGRESRDILSDQNEEGKELKQRIFGLIKDYSAGEFESDDDFQEAKKRLLTEMAEEGLGGDSIGEGALFADNLLQIAQNVKAMAAHREATGESGDVGAILENTDVVLGKASLGARTEVSYNSFERLWKKIESTGWVNETTIMVAASVVHSATIGVAKTAASAVAGTVVPGVLAGTFAAQREARMLKEERSQHIREMAVGKVTEDMTDRRRELEATRYETKPATEMIGQIGMLYNDEGNLKIADKAGFEHAMQTLAEIQARIGVSDAEKVDLISFSSVGEVESERFDLDLALAKVKCDLRRELEDVSDEQLRSFYGIEGIDVARLRAGQGDVWDKRVRAVEGILREGDESHEGIAQKDRICWKLRIKRMSKAFAKGTVLGMALGGGLGAVIQEGAAFAIPDQQGALEGALGLDSSADHQTVINSAFGGPEGSLVVSGEMSSTDLGQYSTLNLPEELTATPNLENNTLAIAGPEGQQFVVEMTPDGYLADEARNILEEAGLTVDVQSAELIASQVAEPVSVDAHEFIQSHDNLTTEVTRDFWYDNGTNNLAEGSELGIQQPYLDSDGNVVVSIAGMDSMATSSTGAELNWHEAAANGELKIALSTSEGTQSDVFMLGIDTDGNAIIPKDSPVANLFGEDGEFNGKFMEVVEVAEVDDDGVTHIRPLATAEGAALETFDDVKVVPEAHEAMQYTLNFAAPEVETGAVDVVVPPVIPVYGREGIGGVDNRRSEIGRSPARQETEPSNVERKIPKIEEIKSGQAFEAKFAKYQGSVRFVGTSDGNTYLFSRVDKSGKQLPGKPAFYTLYKTEVAQALRNGKLKTSSTT